MVGSSKDFKVAIIGGGIGGLALAVGLTRGGVKVDVFEQSPKFEEIGAGVAIGVNAVYALRNLGVMDAILQRGTEPQRPGLFLSGLPGHQDILDYPEPPGLAVAVHRAHFLDTLLKLIPQNTTHLSKKCINVASLASGEVEASFEDGTTYIANLIVGCDGIRSVVRNAVVGQPGSVKYTRTVAYRGLIPTRAGIAVDERLAQRPLVFLGVNRHIVVFPIKDQELINIVAFSTDRSSHADEQAPKPGEPWVVSSTQAEMLAQYDGWGSKVLDLLRHIENPKKWFLHSLDPPLDSYVRGQMALLGDAAHSMLPHLGAGAGQAMEDALILSQLLTHKSTNLSNLGLVLEAYDHVRRPRANHILTSSYGAGEIYEYNGPSGGSLEGLRKDLGGIWESLWHHDLEGDYRKAVKLLADKNVFTSQP